MSDLYLMSSQYRKLDLYHLLVLKTLLEERNVSRTAEKLSVSQPAISKSLAKLRDVLEDELFERGKGQLIPTARALSLNDKLDRIFAQVNDVVKPQPFDPKLFKGHISLAIIAPLIPIVLPTLMQELTSQAPGLSLSIPSLSEGYLRHGEGQADILLTWDNSEAALRSTYRGYLCHPVIKDHSLVGLVRARHPLADTAISLDTYLNQTHLTPRLRLPELEMAQLLLVALERHEHYRKVVLDCNQIGVLLAVLKQTDHLLGLPGTIGRALAREDPALGVVDLMQVSRQIELPELSFNLLTREGDKNSPIHRWLRHKVTAILRRQLVA